MVNRLRPSLVGICGSPFLALVFLVLFSVSPSLHPYFPLCWVSNYTAASVHYFASYFHRALSLLCQGDKITCWNLNLSSTYYSEECRQAKVRQGTFPFLYKLLLIWILGPQCTVWYYSLIASQLNLFFTKVPFTVPWWPFFRLLCMGTSSGV